MGIVSSPGTIPNYPIYHTTTAAITLNDLMLRISCVK